METVAELDAVVSDALATSELAKVVRNVLEDNTNDQHAEQGRQLDVNLADPSHRHPEKLHDHTADKGQQNEDEKGEDGSARCGDGSKHRPRNEECGDDGGCDGECGRHVASWREKFCGNSVGLELALDIGVGLFDRALGLLFSVVGGRRGAPIFDQGRGGCSGTTRPKNKRKFIYAFSCIK